MKKKRISDSLLYKNKLHSFLSSCLFFLSPCGADSTWRRGRGDRVVPSIGSLSQQALWKETLLLCWLNTSDIKWVGFFPHQPILYHHLGSNNLTQFWHCLPGDSIRTHRLRAQSHEYSLNSMPVSSSGVPKSPTLLSNSPIIWGSHYSLFKVQSFARAAHKTQRKACWYLPVHYIINWKWFLVAQTVKNLPAVQKTRGQEDPLQKEWLPTPVFLPGKLHGQRSQVGSSLQDHRVRHDWVTNTSILYDEGWPTR